MELTLLYVHATEIGYARAGTYLAQELSSRGVTVYDDDGRPEREQLSPRKLSTDGRNTAISPTNVVCCVSVPTHMDGWYEGQHASMFTMWEATLLPESFRETIHEFDLIIVPSLHNVELFSHYHPNVQLCLLGVDAARWHYIPPREPRGFFDFLISGRGTRKGVDLAYNAFRTVFANFHPKDRPIPRLVMKSLKGLGEYYGPDIVHVTGRLSDQAELELYAAAQCYLQPSRGEGFGLQPLQAMALGRPTILTNAHGHASFAHLGVPVSARVEPADYFVWGDAGDWWEPDFDELCESIWHVYNNYHDHCQTAEKSAQIIAEQFTWANTADRFVELLGPEMSKPYAGSGMWHKPEACMFEVITVQDFYTEIAGAALFFQQGKSYHVVADVKRILFDAGILSKDCLRDVDHGLAPQQVDQLELARATNEYCPTCRQQLGSGVTASDEIYAELAR